VEDEIEVLLDESRWRRIKAQFRDWNFRVHSGGEILGIEDEI